MAVGERRQALCTARRAGCSVGAHGQRVHDPSFAPGDRGSACSLLHTAAWSCAEASGAPAASLSSPHVRGLLLRLSSGLMASTRALSTHLGQVPGWAFGSPLPSCTYASGVCQGTPWTQGGPSWAHCSVRSWGECDISCLLLTHGKHSRHVVVTP